MAIFTAIAAALELTAFWTTAFVTVASIATSIGISYLAKALAGNPNQTPTPSVGGVQGALQSGADTPRSFNLGYSVTAGSLVWANYWGSISPGGTMTPNAYLTQVIALADLPGGTLQEVWVNGEKCTLGGTDSPFGSEVLEYVKDGQPYFWVKYYDGTQTAADPLCVNYAASSDRPYPSTRIGTGVAYVVVTSLVNDTLFSGFPTFRFAVSGIPLYDPTKDSTNGGSGSHRWSDPTTWGGDGDNFPVVQAYNLLRGIYYNGKWLYGLQRMTSARLPAVNWNAQIDKCRATIAGVSGAEPTYRTGGQVSVNVQTVQTVESLLSGCQGKLSEIGGFYKIHVGAPDSPTFSFTDDDILSTEEQKFEPFFALANSVNGIQASYPSPADGWNMKPAPPLYNSDYEAEDGSRRLLANPTLDFVPYDAQVQRLQKSALQEARRARRHDMTLPPPFWPYCEPGEFCSWTSTRNGYDAKQFRIDGVTDRANLDCLVNLTEVDPSDYSWTHSTDFVPVIAGPNIIPRPAPQGVIEWFAEPYTLLDTAGEPRRPAIRLAWDGTVVSVDGVQYEVRLTADASSVTRGRTDQLAVGSIIVTQSLLPNTAYQVRGQYLPSWPRDMLWSDWLDVTTPDVRLSLAEFDAALTAQVTTIQDALNDKLAEFEQQLATLTSAARASNWMDKKEVRSQLISTYESNVASIESIQTAYTSADAALASDITTVSTTVAGNTAAITTNATAISTLNSSFGSYQTTVNAHLGTLDSSVTTNSTAIATINGYAAAQYSVTLDVNGYASGFNLVNGGSGFSTFVVKADKFQIQLPGYNGNAPLSIFTVGTLNGSPAVGITGNVYLDGVLTSRTIATGEIKAINMAANSITAANGAIADLTVTTLKIQGNAVTQPVGQTFSTPVTLTNATQRDIGGFTLSVDTTGDAGRVLKLMWSATFGLSLSASDSVRIQVKINGVLQTPSIDAATAGGSTNVTATGTGFVSWTASGGMDTFVFDCLGSAGGVNSSVCNIGSLWVLGAKR